MDKVEHEEFAGGEESIEDWLDGLEAKMEAVDIRGDVRKVKWCKARIGSTGLQVLKGIEPINSWDQAKTELKSYFGDDDDMDTAWRNLEYYHSDSKSLGEIAAEVAKYARKASREEYTQQRLALRAFINAVPKHIGNKLREKRITTLKKALEEAKYLQTLQDEKERNKPVNTVEIQPLEGEQEDLVEIQNQTYRNRGATGFSRRFERDLETPYPPRETRRDLETPYPPRETRRDLEMPYPPRGLGRNLEMTYPPNGIGRNLEMPYPTRGRGFNRPRRTECWICRRPGHFARECTLWIEFLQGRGQKELPVARGDKRLQEEEEVMFQLNW